MKSNNLTKLVLSAVLLIGAIAQVQAEDKKADASGTYVWTTPGRNGGPAHTNTLVLKAEGDKLTGTLSVPGRDGNVNSTDITGGKVTGSDVSFCVVRSFRGNTMTNNYTGTLDDGTIKGKMSFVNRNGEEQSRDWEAKQQKQ